MSTEPWIRIALEASLENYEVFLTARGFTRTEDLGGRASVYEGPNGEAVLLPQAATYDDYSLRIAELVDSLARILGEDRDNLSKLIASVGYDVFKIRTEIGRSSYSVDLDDALDLLHNGYSIVDYSAVYATSNKTVSYVHGRRTKEVSTYLDSVRMGQTEPGSFVLTLLLPVVGRRDLVRGSSVLSLGQRVSDAIVSGLQSSKEVLAEFEREGETKPGEFPANFASALAEIVKRSPEVEMGVNQRATGATHRVSFGRKDEEPLREIADSLTPRVKSWTTTISGTVVSVTEPRGQKNGAFTIEALIEGALKNVKVPFTREDRKMVIQAFDEKADLKLKLRGRLVKNYSGRYSVERPQQIRTVKRGKLA